MQFFDLAKRAGRYLAICSVFGLTLIPGLSGADETDAFNMMVISNQAYGKALLAGDHESAIARISAKSEWRRDRFAASNNLCVAYVRARQADRAMAACKRAVDRSRRASRRDQAIALSNLGVVRALTGDVDGALHSFQAAMRLEPELEIPAANLGRLFSRNSGRSDSQA